MNSTIALSTKIHEPFLCLFLTSAMLVSFLVFTFKEIGYLLNITNVAGVLVF